jgi:6-phospho-beta-glucosidase
MTGTGLEHDVGLKVAVIGGGSTYTPELIEGLAARQAALPIDEVALQDLDPERLGIVAGLARRIVARTEAPIRVTETTDRAAALDGVDFVLIQLRVGGQAARLVDETLPLRFGCVGQETTGPGGFAKALRTVPVVLEIADEAERRATPGAWIVDFTNPVGIVTQALLDAGHRAIGLCNVAIGLQRRLAELWGVAPERVELEHVGLNHLTWLRAARVDGVDRLPGLIEHDLSVIVDEAEMPHSLVRAMGAIPSYYLRFYYMTGEVLTEQRDGHSRAEDVIEIERELLELYRDSTLDRKPVLLERRGGAYYSEAAAQLIASLHSGTGDVQVVDTRNLGTIAGLPEDAVVEVPARIDRSGATPLPQTPLAPDMLGLVQAVKAYEMLTTEAARTGDRNVALRALLANPLVPDYPTAVALLDAFLATDAARLPRFATNVP